MNVPILPQEIEELNIHIIELEQKNESTLFNKIELFFLFVGIECNVISKDLYQFHSMQFNSKDVDICTAYTFNLIIFDHTVHYNLFSVLLYYVDIDVNIKLPQVFCIISCAQTCDMWKVRLSNVETEKD